jgi:antitoxin ParD1/3/4
MSKNTSFNLSDHFGEFIQNQVSAGLYDNASSGLRLLEDQESKLSALRAALVEGENSGEATEFDFDEFLARKNHEHNLTP